MRLSIIIIVLCGMFIMPVSAQDCIPAAGDPVTFGAVFPLDFLLLDDSNSAYHAVLAMTEVYNQCNGGTRPVEWQLEVATTYDDAVSAMARFSESDIPLVIGSGMESISEGLNDVATDYGIVFLDVTERPRQELSEWSFAMRPDDTALGSRTAQYIQTDVAGAVLEEPLRLALVVEDTARALEMADAVRGQLAGSIVLDTMLEHPTELAVNIRESDANVLLLISISDDATNLWYAMRQADANVSAWMFLGQEQLTITQRYVDDRDTTGVIIVSSRHVAVNNIEQAFLLGIYDSFLEHYATFTDDAPDRNALNASVGTYYLLFPVLSEMNDDISADNLRGALELTSSTGVFQIGDALPLSVYQQQDEGYCLLAPASFATCNQSIQVFPTWRQRILDNQ